MPPKPSRSKATDASPTEVSAVVESTLAALQRRADPKVREQMQRQFGIKGDVADSAFGLRISEVRAIAKATKKRGKAHDQWNHALALALWETAQYEARMAAVFVDVPSLVTPAQMDRWARGFTDWAVCDTACFLLFDRTPHAFAKSTKWATSSHEFVKRAAFALLAGVALHDKVRSDDEFLPYLALIELASRDSRNFVKKGVSWALRGIGKRSPRLRKHARAVAKRLAESPEAAARWVGKDALRDLA